MSPPENGDDLELRLRRILREELGLTAVVPADKWRGGELILRPGKPGLQEKKWPIDELLPQDRDDPQPAADPRAAGQRLRPAG